MTCKNVEKRLSAYLDQRLPAAERSEIDGHLGGCDGCRQSLGLLRGASRLMARMGPAEPRPGLSERLARVAIAAEKRPAQSWLASLLPMAWPWATAAAAAAALLLVLGGGGPSIPASGDLVPTAGVLGATDLGADPPSVAASILGEEEL
jgi:anti-sigma factor RsiW